MSNRRCFLAAVSVKTLTDVTDAAFSLLAMLAPPVHVYNPTQIISSPAYRLSQHTTTAASGFGELE